MSDEPTTKEQDILLVKELYEKLQEHKTPYNLRDYMKSRKWFEAKHNCLWADMEKNYGR